MLSPPLSVMATWPTPNYVNPPTHGPTLLILDVVLLVIVLVIVGLRYYTRLHITHSFGADDIFIGLALIPTVGLASLMIITYDDSSLNRHIWDILPSDLSTMLQLELAGQLLFAFASSLTKLSLSSFCLQLVSNTGRKAYVRVIIGSMVVQVGLCLSFTSLVLLQCRPLSAYWTINPTYHYSCIDGGIFVLVYGLLNSATDVFYLLLPIPIIWQLALPSKQRIATSCLFGLGILVCFSGIARVIYADMTLRTTYDPSWWAWAQSLSAAIEIDLGVVCASSPALRPMLARHVPRLLENARSGNFFRLYPSRQDTNRGGSGSHQLGERAKPQIVQRRVESHKGDGRWKEKKTVTMTTTMVSTVDGIV